MIKLYQVGNVAEFNADYDEEQFSYFMTSEAAQRECSAQRDSEIDPDSKIVPGFFITAAELEQREREFYQAGQDSIVVIERTSYNDYLKQRNREQALSDLVADGEENGDYDDYLKQRKES